MTLDELLLVTTPSALVGLGLAFARNPVDQYPLRECFALPTSYAVPSADGSLVCYSQKTPSQTGGQPND